MRSKSIWIYVNVDKTIEFGLMEWVIELVSVQRRHDIHDDKTKNTKKKKKKWPNLTCDKLPIFSLFADKIIALYLSFNLIPSDDIRRYQVREREREGEKLLCSMPLCTFIIICIRRYRSQWMLYDDIIILNEVLFFLFYYSFCLSNCELHSYGVVRMQCRSTTLWAWISVSHRYAYFRWHFCRWQYTRTRTFNTRYTNTQNTQSQTLSIRKGICPIRCRLIRHAFSFNFF